MKKRTAGKIRKRKRSRVFAAAFLAGIVACLSGCAAPKSGGLSSSKNFQSGEILSVNQKDEKVEILLSKSGETVSLDFSEMEESGGTDLKEGDYIYYSTWGNTPEKLDVIEKTAPYTLNYEVGSGEIVSIDTEEMIMTVKLDRGMEFYDDSTAVLDYSCSTGWLKSNKDFEVNPGDSIYYSFFDGKPEEIYCIERIVSEEA